MRSLPAFTVSAAAALLAFAGAAPAAGPPPRGSVNVVTQLADCRLTDTGYVARYLVRVNLNWIGASQRPGTFYLQSDARIDITKGRGWAKLERRAQETAKFANAPWYTTIGVRSHVGQTAAGDNLRGKLTVKLRKSDAGPDTTIWKFTITTPPFTCTVPDWRGPVG